jgi:tRNA pseudouridine38-40 synthase
MRTFKLTIAYDGTEFVGWQRQAAGTSIQGLIEKALGELDGREVSVVGASRTDAGVHAIGQVAGVAMAKDIDAASLVRAANTRLPASVRVLDAVQVPDTFHAQFDASAKTYRYRIRSGSVMLPFERAYAWHVPLGLDRQAMASAAAVFAGRHDFAAFQSAGAAVATTERVVHSSRIADGTGIEHEARDVIVFEIRGGGFLRHMVRTMVGTLVEVGRGARPPSWAAEVLASRDRARAGRTAPAKGLFLVSVEYE